MDMDKPLYFELRAKTAFCDSKSKFTFNSKIKYQRFNVTERHIDLYHS
jgi:hypothetical protein